MKNLLKKLTLQVFGTPVRYVISQMNLHEEVNNKIENLDAILYDALPTTWIINEQSTETIDRIKKTFALPEDLNMNIHKNDLMFRTFLANNFTIPDSFKAYLVRSVHFMDILTKVAEKKWSATGQDRTGQDRGFQMQFHS